MKSNWKTFARVRIINHISARVENRFTGKAIVCYSILTVITQYINYRNVFHGNFRQSTILLCVWERSKTNGRSEFRRVESEVK